MLKAGQDYYFLVIEAGYWGRYKTEKEAKQNCKKAGGSLKHYQVYLADPEVRIDDMGYICYPEGGKEPILFKQVKAGKEVPLD